MDRIAATATIPTPSQASTSLWPALPLPSFASSPPFPCLSQPQNAFPLLSERFLVEQSSCSSCWHRDPASTGAGLPTCISPYPAAAMPYRTFAILLGQGMGCRCCPAEDQAVSVIISIINNIHLLLCNNKKPSQSGFPRANQIRKWCCAQRDYLGSSIFRSMIGGNKAFSLVVPHL